MVAGQSDDEVLDACRRVVASAHRALHGLGDGAPGVADLDVAVHMLRRLVGELEVVPDQGVGGARQVLSEVRRLQLAIQETRLQRRSVVTAELQAAVGRLRAEATVGDVLRRVPVELGTLGYSRSLLSRLRGRDWGATGAFAHEDKSLADALVRVGRSVPGRIGREEPETEMVRRQLPIIVRDAQRKPRVHRELITLADTRDYVAAPIVANGTVVALLHVDRHSQADLLDGFDRDLVGLFAHGAGLALECARTREQFDGIQRRLGGLWDVIDGSGQWDGDDTDGGADLPGSTVLEWPHPPPGPLDDLTRREWEVLRYLANGAANQEIASRLGVSIATVKTHVKHVLRKLGATNRADAAARLRQYTTILDGDRRSALGYGPSRRPTEPGRS